MIQIHSSTSPFDRVVLFIVGLLPVALATTLPFPGWTIRAALVVPLTAIGACALAGARDRAAAAALVFLVAVAVAAIACDAPISALLGRRDWFLGVTAVAAAVCAWGAGRALSQRGRDILPIVLVIGGVANGVAAILQALAIYPLNVPDPSIAFGRATGFLENPIQLGALLGACVAVAVARVAASPRWTTVLAVVVIVTGVNLAGGRAGLGMALLGLVWSLRRKSWGIRGLTLAAAAVGFALALLLGAIGASLGAVRPSASAVARTTSMGGDLDSRDDAWHAGLIGLRDSPLLGLGPGRFEAAAQPHRSSSSARVTFIDAHNWAVEYLTTTGVVGFFALILWLGLSAVDARGPLATFALLIAVGALLQPASVTTTPLALVALGGSSSIRTQVPRLRRFIAPTLVGGLVGGFLIVGHLYVRDSGRTSGRAAIRNFERARALLPDWPDLLREGAVMYSAARSDRQSAATALDLAEAAAEREPADVKNWLVLATVQTQSGRHAAAHRSLLEARRVDPRSIAAIQLLVADAVRRGDSLEAERLCEKAHQLSPRSRCP